MNLGITSTALTPELPATSALANLAYITCITFITFITLGRPNQPDDAMRLNLTLIASMIIALAGCAGAPSQVRVDKAEGVDLARCQSFDWLPQTKDAATLTDQRVRAAALATLERKGYTLSTDNPDCRISYVLTTHERPREKPQIGVGAGGGSRGVGGGIGVSLPIGQRNQFGATLVLDIVDAAKNAQIWSGTLDASIPNQELSEEGARAIVQEILAEFPSRK